MPGTLYIVATPIGNLADMTPRGVQVLHDADMIAAEDTRHSRVLLAHFGIKTPSFSCHKFNEEKRGDFFIQVLLEGKNIALISDAGTPCISDPGHKLVKLAGDNGIDVVAVCGANAVAAALSVSGFDASNFIFLGFLPRTQKEQADIFSIDMDCPVVFFESPLRITKTLGWLAEAYPNADICLCNDLTKKFEKVYRGRVGALLEKVSNAQNARKGEYTCVVRLNAEKAQPAPEHEFSLEAQLVDIMIKESCTLKDATNILHAAQKSGKKSIYAAALRVKELFV